MASTGAASKPAETVDDYIAGCPDDVRPILEQVRQAIHSAVPGATERISYAIAAIDLGGRGVIHFAGWKQHVGLYPVHEQDADLEPLVSPFRTTKSTVNFRYRDGVPYELIGRIAAAEAARTDSH